MEMILTFLIGIGSTLAVQWGFHKYTDTVNYAYQRKLKQDLMIEDNYV